MPHESLLGDRCLTRLRGATRSQLSPEMRDRTWRTSPELGRSVSGKLEGCRMCVGMSDSVGDGVYSGRWSTLIANPQMGYATGAHRFRLRGSGPAHGTPRTTWDHLGPLSLRCGRVGPGGGLPPGRRGSEQQRHTLAAPAANPLQTRGQTLFEVRELSCGHLKSPTKENTKKPDDCEGQRSPG